MKFSGIISSLAIASAVSAAALPFAPIDDVKTTLSGAVGTVKGAASEVTGNGIKGLPLSVPATRKRDTLVPVKVPSPADNLVGAVGKLANGANLPAANLPAAGDLPINGLPTTGGLPTRDLPATPNVSDVAQNLPKTGAVTDNLPATGTDDVAHKTNLALLGPIFKQLVEDCQKESWDDFEKHFHVLLLYVDVADLLQLLAAIPALESHYH